jgi:hypothetical protein
MIGADGQRLAVAAPEIDVDDLRAHVPGRSAARRHQRDDVRRRDVGDREAAGADLGEIVVEPGGERGVHVDDGAARIDRQEAGGSMVEVVDRVLEFLEDVLLPLPLVRDVGHRPECHGPVTRTGQRPHPDPVPAEIAARGGEGRRETDLLARGPVLAGGLSQAVDRLRHLRRAREQALDRTQAARAVAASEQEVALVRVDDPPPVLHDEAALRGRVRHELGEVVARSPPHELKRADRIGEQKEHARHGEQRHQAVDERRRLLVGDEKKRDKRADQHAGEEKNQPDVAAPLRPVDRGSRRQVAYLNHENAFVLRDRKPSRSRGSPLVLPAACSRRANRTRFASKALR